MDNSSTIEYDKEINYLTFYHTALRNITQMTLIGFTVLVVKRYYSGRRKKAFEEIFLVIALIIFTLSLYEIHILDKQLSKLSKLSKNKLYINDLVNLPKIYAVTMIIVQIYIIYLLSTSFIK